MVGSAVVRVARSGAELAVSAGVAVQDRVLVVASTAPWQGLSVAGTTPSYCGYAPRPPVGDAVTPKLASLVVRSLAWGQTLTAAEAGTKGR